MAIPKDVLDDLASRFLLSLPPEEREDPVRVCFQAERAHWFYIDNISFYEKSAACPKCNVRHFIREIFKHCSFLQRHVENIDEILDKWREYKGEIPTHGAILMDESLECVLLVQGYHSKASWGFPKGKCNEEELPHHCAIREVKEETGFDIGSLLNENDYIERHIFETPNRLYIVCGVPRDYAFEPVTRNEIKECRWFKLDTLPTSKTDLSNSPLGIYPNNFYMVFPYVEQLKRFVAKKRRKSGGSRNQTNSSNGDTFHNDPSGRRSQPRNRSVSYSSPSADRNRQSYANANGTPDKGQGKNSATKKSTLKRSKKNASKEKFNESETTATQKSTTTAAPVSTEIDQSSELTTKLQLVKIDIQPSRAWREFKFSWNGIFPEM